MRPADDEAVDQLLAQAGDALGRRAELEQEAVAFQQRDPGDLLVCTDLQVLKDAEIAKEAAVRLQVGQDVGRDILARRDLRSGGASRRPASLDAAAAASRTRSA